VKLRVLSSWLLLFFPPCQWAAQATSNVQKFSPPTRTYIEEIGQPDHLRLVFNADVFTPTGRTKDRRDLGPERQERFSRKRLRPRPIFRSRGLLRTFNL
jgi:hypothetical protein